MLDYTIHVFKQAARRKFQFDSAQLCIILERNAEITAGSDQIWTAVTCMPMIHVLAG